ncbi:MAG: M24 family metallopeptidase [Clostridia bacterium]|nr:M24 family metallopeptidase [Clostridia bacterium]
MLFGHGLGMNVHEDPVISPKNERNLKENMVIAVEPRNIFTR